MVTKTAPVARAKSKMELSAAPGPSPATSRVLCAVCPRFSAAATRLLPQHSSMRRYMPCRAELASRGTPALRRESVEKGGCLDLVARQIVLVLKLLHRGALPQEVSDEACGDSGPANHGLAGQHLGAALDIASPHGVD